MIRDATQADLPRLQAIQSAALVEPWDGLLEPAIAGPPVVLVVEPGDGSGIDGDTAPVGYAVAITDGDSAYLPEIAVAPGYRRQGHGSALLSAVCDRLVAAGCARLELTVHVADRGARAFYDHHGFTVRSLLPEHFSDGDGLVMVRSLGPRDGA